MPTETTERRRKTQFLKQINNNKTQQKIISRNDLNKKSNQKYSIFL